MAEQDNEHPAPPPLPPEAIGWLHKKFDEWLKKQSTTAEERLSPDIRDAVMYELVADYTLRQGYAHLAKQAREKNIPITGEAIAEVEKPYNRMMADFDRQIDSVLKKVTDKHYRESRSSGTTLIDGVKDVPVLGALASVKPISIALSAAERSIIHGQLTADYSEVYYDKHRRLREIPSHDMDAIVATFNRNFRQHYLKGAPEKNLEIGPDVKTVPDLLSTLIAQNAGIVIADIHVEREPPKLVTDQMALFKKAGVDTIYIEQDQARVEKYAKLSDDELRKLIQERKLEGTDIKLWSAEEVAQNYGMKYSDDVEPQWIQLELAAREHGIRIVGMDSASPAAGADSGLRIPSTNPVWTDNIKRDREQLVAEGRGGGKYVVIGGLGHFINSHDERGYVDEALGLPVLTYNRSKVGAAPFERADGKNGADFYLAADPHYYPARAIDRIEREVSLVRMLENVRDKTDNEWLKDFTRERVFEWRSSIFDRQLELHEQYDATRPSSDTPEVVAPKTPDQPNVIDKDKTVLR